MKNFLRSPALQRLSMMRSLAALACSIFLFCVHPQHTEQDAFGKLREEYIRKLGEFDIPALQLNFKENIVATGTPSSLPQQELYFAAVDKQLRSIDGDKLEGNDRLDYQLLRYEVPLQLERVRLQQDNKDKASLDTISKIFQLGNGRDWYRYFLKKWIGDEVDPDDIYRFGLAQLGIAQENIGRIRKKSGMQEQAFYAYLDEPLFSIRDESLLKKKFGATRDTIAAHLGNLFNEYDIPNMKIARGTNAGLNQAPGYYYENTFFYNLFDKSFNSRQADWLYIHEGIPGHHFQGSIARANHRTKLQELLHYSGFAEGWAAYVEQYGKELGVYPTLYDELGRWEWDIVRSARVPMDIGINYYGWTDEQAMTFWKKNILHQDDIAQREINRLKRWPVQAITYKYGAAKIDEWKRSAQAKKGIAFSLKSFHDSILKRGSLPFSVLKEYIQ